MSKEAVRKQLEEFIEEDNARFWDDTDPNKQEQNHEESNLQDREHAEGS